MPHKFDPHHLHHLDNPLRRIFYPAGRILKDIGLAAGDVFIDIGAGSGYYTFPASEIVGDKGKVIAVDMEPIMINVLTEKNTRLGKKNIEIVQSTESDLGVAQESGSLALLSMVFHEMDDRKGMLAAIRRSLHEKGRLAIIEFRKGKLIFGPPNHVRIAKEELVRLLAETGFTDVTVANMGLSFYIARAVK